MDIRLHDLFWASGYEPGAHSLGLLWFLISLFWARFIIRSFLVVFDEEKVPYLCIALGALACIAPGRHLPQNLDVTVVAVMFLAIGHLWKINSESIHAHRYPIFLAAVTFWGFCVSQGMFIELAARQYPFGMACVLESACGTFVCCCVSDALASNRWIKRPLLFLGRHTLMLMCVHSLDGYWSVLWSVPTSPGKSSIARLLIDLAIWGLTLGFITLGQRLLRNGDSK